jgi:hypothetical protein
MGGLNMDYDVNIKFINKKNEESKEEIWAEIFNPINGKTLKKLIWWKDNTGLIHDESSKLPIKLRSIVDIAWINAIKKL